MRRFGVLMAGAGIMLTLAACEPTGDIRCDRHADILIEIEAHGWTTDCAPDFPNVTPDGNRVAGWADPSTKQVVLWPDVFAHHGALRKTLWHELAHVRGIYDEVDADTYSWCREAIEGVGYRVAGPDAWPPTGADCRRVGAR